MLDEDPEGVKIGAPQTVANSAYIIGSNIPKGLKNANLWQYLSLIFF